MDRSKERIGEGDLGKEIWKASAFSIGIVKYAE
jgi:hypothetical protein